MTAEIRVFRCLSDNIGALIHDPATGACAAVDAPEEAPIVKALEETGWTLSEIIVTHRHADHVQAIEPLKRCTGWSVVSPEKARGQVPAEKAQAEGRFLIPSTVGEEKATNPFLCAGEPALARSVKMEGAEPVAVFQSLRRWKNRF